MYTRYFGFSEKPFTLTPNPRFIFLSKQHKEAFAHLLYGINNHYGFIELIGEVGTGKTTVLRTLLEQLQDEGHRCALIFNPCLTGVELLKSINQEFGIDSSSSIVIELLTELNRFLLAENRDGRTVVLVIDEAQILQADVLEQIRLISNLETENDKLIQIILAGQPELEAMLQRRNLRQLNQRIAVRYRLQPMSREDAQAYIRHRMEVAGETGGVSFSRLAISLIYLYTRGVPRMINVLCDRSLLMAYGEEHRGIGAFTVVRSIAELHTLPRIRHLTLTAVYLCLIGLLIILGLSFANRPTGWPRTKQQTVAAEPSAAQGSAMLQRLRHGEFLQPQASAPTDVDPVHTASSLEQQLLASDQNEIHLQAFNALALSWGVAPVRIFKGSMTVPATFGRIAAKRNLQLTAIRGTLDDAVRFDLPFLVVTKVSGKLGKYCFAVTSAQNDSLSISPPLAGSSTIAKDVMARLAGGTFYLLWKNSGRIPDTLTLGVSRSEIRSLQKLLAQAGCYHGPLNGEYTDATIRAVRQFQQSHGITLNDALGAPTLAALSRLDTTHAVPSLKGN